MLTHATRAPFAAENDLDRGHPPGDARRPAGRRRPLAGQSCRIPGVDAGDWGFTTLQYAENADWIVEGYYTNNFDGAGTPAWDLSGTDSDDFTISDTGSLEFKSPPDFENPTDSNTDNVYQVTISATLGAQSASTDVTVTVTNEQEPGVISFSTQNLRVGVQVTGTISDPDGGVSDIEWSWPNGVVAGGLSSSYTLAAGDIGAKLDAYATYTDGATPAEAPRSGWAEGTSEHVVLSASPPVFAISSASRSVAENSAAGTALGAAFTATDADQDPLTYSLEGTDAASFAIDDSTGQVSTRAALDFENQSSYSVVVKAADQYDDADTVNVTISVTNVDEPGTVTLSTQQPDLTGSVTATLTDPDGSVSGASWQWSHHGGNDINGATSSTYTPVNSDRGRRLVATASYRDALGSGKSASAQTDHPVKTVANQRPVFANPTAQRSVPENTAAGVALGAPLTATDPDGHTLTYVIPGPNAAVFHLDPNSGQLSTKGPLNFENRSIYNVTIRARDPHEHSEMVVTITVTDVDEPLTPISGEAAVSYVENGVAAVANYTAADPEGPATVWSLEGTDAADFRIDAGGQLFFIASPDFESPADDNSDNAYEVTVVATVGEQRETLAVTVTVTDITGSATVTGPEGVNFREHDTSSIGTYTTSITGSKTWSLGGPDAALFKITNQGVLSFRAAPNFEHKRDADADSRYELKVRASNATNEGELGVTVTVFDVNEKHEFGIQGRPHEDYVVSRVEGSELVAATFSMRDPEGAAPSAFSWTVHGTDRDDFTIADGVLSFKTAPSFDAPTDADTDNLYLILVRADDADHGWSRSIHVRITEFNRAPTVACSGVDETCNFTINENTTGSIGTITVTDPDGDPVTAHLHGLDSGGFAIERSEFQIGDGVSFHFGVKVAPPDHVPPDYEAPTDAEFAGHVGLNNVYEISLEVKDGKTSSWVHLKVTVQNVEESPRIEGPTEVNFAEDGTGDVATYAISDDEDDTFTVAALAGADADRFNFNSATGVLRFTSPPDADAPADADSDNDYEITISATDEDGTTTKQITVTVTGDNEAPVIAGSGAIQFAENGTGAVRTFTATDPESDAITWSKTGPDAAKFSIQGGVLRFRETPDYESPADADGNNVYVFTLKASDGSLHDTLSVSVSVTDVNEGPAVTGLTAITVAENSTGALATYSASDPEGETFTFSAGGPQGGYFSVDSDGVLTFKARPDFEESQYYTVNVVATDSSGNKGRLAVQVTLTDVNEPPEWDYHDELTIQEHMTVADWVVTFRPYDPDTSDWDAVITNVQLLGADAARFTLTGTEFGYELRIRASPDFEAPADANSDNAYEITLRSTSKGLTGDHSYTVPVTNIDEDGSLVLSSTSPVEGVELTATLTDPDGGVSAATYIWTVGGSDVQEGSSNRFTPRRGDAGSQLSVGVEYTDAHGEGKWVATEAGNVGAQTNQAPAFPSTETGQRSVDENTAAYTTIGAAFVASDGNGDAISYEVSGTDAASFDFFVDEVGARLATLDALDYEEKRNYSLTLTASDTHGGSTTKTITIAVNNIDEPGAITLAHEEGLEVRQAVTATLSDPDGAPSSVSWQWSRVDGETETAITGATGSSYTLTGADVEKRLKVTASYTDPQGANKSASATTAATVAPAPNRDPAFPATETGARSIPENTPAGTNIGAPFQATDPDGETVAYALTGSDASHFEIDAESGQLKTKGALNHEADGSYGALEVTATDPSGGAVGLVVTVTVTDVDEPPVVIGPASTSYAENDEIVVASYSARDPEGGTSFTWSLDGADKDLFSISSTGALTFKAPPDYENKQDAGENNVYDITIEASDGAETGSRAVQVTVTNVDEAPTLTGDTEVDKAEGSDKTVATYTAADPEGASLTWSLSGTERDDFEISGGVLSFKQAPDYESPTDNGLDNTYRLTVNVADGTGAGANSASLNILVTVTAVNEPPVIAGAATKNFAENGTGAVATYAATDPEQAASAIGWTLAGDDAALFSITGGVLRFAAPPDFENKRDTGADNVYDVTVQADDGTNTASFPVAVTVTNVDEAPAVSGAAAVEKPEGPDKVVGTYSAVDPEGVTAITWTLGGTDAADFAISSTGQLSFAAAPDYDNPADAGTNNVYNVTVKASDGAKTGELAVTVTVTDVNFGPRLKTGETTIAVDENFNGDLGGSYEFTDREGDPIVVTLAGADADKFSWELSEILNLKQYHLRFKSVPDHEIPHDANTDNVYEITIEMSDGTTTTRQAVTITVNEVSEPPRLAGPAAVDYAENGSGDVASYTASDDEGDSFTLALSGADAERFTLTNGVLKFKQSPDYESPADAGANNKYQVTVGATDVNDNTSTIELTVTVTNVNEAPVITGDATKDYAENGTAAVATYAASDPEGVASLTWDLSGADAELFEISSAGALSFKASPDFEEKQDAGANNVYDVTLEVSDGTETGTLAVAVTVTNVNEKPVVSGLATVTRAEGSEKTVATYTATDPDAGATIAWTLEGTDAADFEISTAGVLSFKQAPNRESPQDADTNNEYKVTVKASDGSLSDTLAVTVTVTDVNDPPAITGGAATVSYAENRTDAVATYTAVDPEGATIAWTLAGNDAGDFEISTNGVLTFASQPDYESPSDADTNNTYLVTVQAKDSEHTVERAVTVSVTGVDEPPVISGDAAVNFAENSTAAVATYTATDPENDAVTWSKSGTDEGSFTLTGGVLSFNSPPDRETKSSYSVTVTATANGKSDSVDVTVTITDVNDPPTITAGPTSPSYAENGTGAVATYTASDPEGATIEWSLTGTDAASFTIPSGVLTFAQVPDFESKSSYSVTVTAADGMGTGALSATREVTVTVTDVNEKPTVTGLTTVTKEEGDDKSVGSYTADDPEDDSVTWSLSGDDAGDFEISTSGALSFKQAPNRESPQDADSNNLYKVTVTATDDASPALSGSLDIEVTVTDVNDAPTITAGPTSKEHAENSADAIGTYTATDPEGTTVAWSLSGADDDLFQISTAGVLSFKAAPDFETKRDADSNNQYQLTVKASDGSLHDTREITVSVTNVDEGPAITGSPAAALNYAENGTGAVASYTATDPENDTIAWSKSGTDAADFNLNSSGVLSFAASPDFENKQDANSDNKYEVTVTATAGGKGVSHSVTVTVTDVDEGPAITGSPVAALNYAENGTGAVASYTATDPENDSITWSKSGTDAADFSLNSSGVLSFAASPDFENKQDANSDNKYEVTVTATAGGKTANHSVIVTVTDVNEKPVISGLTTVTKEEGEDKSVGDYGADDPEDGNVTWGLEGDDAGDFEISTSGALSFRQAPNKEDPQDANLDNRYKVTVTATDDATSPLKGTLEVEVTVTDVNDAPTITAGPTSQDHAENSADAIGTYAATDPEGTTVAWSLSGPDDELFQISTAGVLSFQAAPDFETKRDADSNNQYQVTVEASDGSLDDTRDVTVTVTNVDEPPAITGSPATALNYAENGTAAVVTYTATDPESDTIAWTKSGTDAARFTITGGVLNFASSPDFENEQDANSDNKYEVTVTATAGGKGVSHSVTVTVTNVDEAPAITGSPLAALDYAENGTDPIATYAATDPEDDTVSWTKSGTDAASFTITGGVLSFASSPDFEDKQDANSDNRYEVTVTATAGGKTASHSVAITITDENEKPAVSGLTVVTKEEGDDKSVAAYTATDPEGDDVTWSLSGDDAGDFEISSSGALRFLQAPNKEDPQDANLDNRYKVTVTATDDATPALSGSLNVEVTVTDVNDAPSITGGPTSKDHAENSADAIGTYAATDPEGTTVAWSLSGPDEDLFQISTAGVLSFKAAPDFETKQDADANNQYQVTVKASDGSLDDTRAVTVSVTNVDEDGSLTLSTDDPSVGSTVTATLTDPDGGLTSVAYQWSLTVGGTTTPISGATGQTYTPVEGDKTKHLSVSVTYTDALGTSKTLSASATNAVIERQNDPPAFDSGNPSQVNVREDAPNDRAIGLPFTATDPEGNTISFTLAGDDATLFKIDLTTGQLRVKDPLDHETNERHSILIVATDEYRGSSTHPVTVNVTDVDEAPEITGQATLSHAENDETVVASFTATDPEDATVTWSKSGPDSSDFSLSNGQLSFTSVPDYERPVDANRDNAYLVTLTASDGNHSSSLNVTVTVTQVDEAPLLQGPDAVSLAENGTGNVATYSATDPEGEDIAWTHAGPDKDLFQISAAGILSFKAAPDFETKRDADSNNQYQVTVEASDGSLDQTRDVTVTVTDVNEPPVVIGAAAVPFAENGTGVVETYTHSDPEGLPVIWSLAGVDADDFEISSTGQLKFVDPPNYESPGDTGGDNKYNVTVQATDWSLTGTKAVVVTVSDVAEAARVVYSSVQPQVGVPIRATLIDPEGSGSGVTWQWHRNPPIEGATGSTYTPTEDDVGADLHAKASQGEQVVAQTPTTNPPRAAKTSNQAPSFSDTQISISVDENAMASRTVSASDPDSGDLLTYSLSGTHAGHFNIDQSSGALTSKTPLDYETRSSYQLSVTATDPSGESATAALSITVNDVPEPPAVSGPAVAFAKSSSTAPVATYVARDPERQAIAWSVPDGSVFEIDGAGALRFKSTPRHDPANPANNQYVETITATDQGLLSDSITVTVVVTKEAPRQPQSKTTQRSAGSTGGGGSSSPAVSVGGGGGGAPQTPVPSNADFDWNVSRDIKKLHSDNRSPTGIWSDGDTLLVLQNSPSGSDAVFGYDLSTGERRDAVEFQLDRRNRFAHGIWSDGELVWVADSGRDLLFAYELESGERRPGRDMTLDARNRNPRGVWSNGTVLLVVDSVRDALFVYDFNTGKLLEEFGLDRLNRSPRGIWSDGVTIWISDDGAKRLFAYRIEGEELKRVESEEFGFRNLLKAGNGNPNGIWSDGEVFFVADSRDRRVYTYNLPDAIDARLDSLSLGEVEISEFSPSQLEYWIGPSPRNTLVTVAATPAQPGAQVSIAPPDADGDPTNGHQVSRAGTDEITLTVTSEDGSRTRVYRLRIQRGPCLDRLGTGPLAVVRFPGGPVAELDTCARRDGVVALYYWNGRRWLIYAPGIDFLNRAFQREFRDGIPVDTPLIANQPVPSTARGN
ncbi:MAG: cadherin domain-containing protein [Chloroflexota bacterium]|nr:cadherin domain-containing protein [Chloroflexota bacterium]